MSSVLGGHATRTRRICVHGEGIAAVALALAETQGHTIVRPHEHGEGCDLEVVESAHADELEKVEANAPLLVLAPRRLRASEVRHFKDAGAACVLDTSAHVLEVAFAFSDLLFESLCAQRRYARAQGGAQVTFRARDADPAAVPESRGRLVGIARAGTYLITDDLEPAGTPIEMMIELAGQPVRLLGRVACQVGADERRGFGVEFALDSSDVAPRIGDLSARITFDRPLPRVDSASTHLL